MKRNVKKQLALILLGVTFALAGCRDILNSPESAGQSAGNVVITAGDAEGSPEARTLIPSLNGLTYELVFSGSGGAAHSAESFIPGTAKTVQLSNGQWTITARAKAGTEVKAEGVWTGTIDGNTALSITLTPKNSGTGTLAYTITFPNLSGGSTSLALYSITQSGPSATAAATVTALTSGQQGTVANLVPGFYRVDLKLTNSAGTIAGKTWAAHIYPGLSTPVTAVFAAGDFVVATGGGGASTLTADITFQDTITNAAQTAFVTAQWSGQNTASETWRLTSVEKEKTYFGTAKTAAQTISVGGTAAALVTQRTSGSWDGTTASNTLSVFEVDTSSYALMFEGGTCVFTLTVTEANRLPKTITVTLVVSPYKTGIAVFKVTRNIGIHSDILGITDTTGATAAAVTPAQAEAWATSGNLTRITGILKWEMGTTYQAVGSWGTAAGDSLLDAIAWVDHNAEDNEEYLIRLEKNEQIPMVILGGHYKQNVLYRLRGIEAERVITHNGQFAATGAPNPFIYRNKDMGGNVTTSGNGLFYLGGMRSTNKFTASLSLENNVTITLTGTQYLKNVVRLQPNSRFVMHAGAKISGYSSTHINTYTLIEVSNYDSSNPNTTLAGFIMYGGTITGNQIKYVFLAGSNVPTHRFIKTGGSITNNAWTDGSNGSKYKMGSNEVDVSDPAVIHNLSQ